MKSLTQRRKGAEDAEDAEGKIYMGFLLVLSGSALFEKNERFCTDQKPLIGHCPKLTPQKISDFDLPLIFIPLRPLRLCASA